LLLDADSILRYQNSTARQLFGLTEGNRVDAAVLAEMFSMSVAELEQGFDINNPCSTLELERIRQFNGQERLLHWTAMPMSISTTLLWLMRPTMHSLSERFLSAEG